jgi:hypothetical protein
LLKISFVTQDAAQGLHWNNSQATLHPFVGYFKNAEGEVEHISMCVISNCLQHATVTVYKFQTTILAFLKDKFPSLNKVYYFSDGAASQYKNFSNLAYHKVDFGIQAEWHFFATSHGKNACDGVGGTVKREAAKASLQAATGGHILTPEDLYQWSKKHILNVHFFVVDKSEMESTETMLKERFARSQTVPGTRSHHCFIPTPNKKLCAYRVSGDESHFEVNIVQAGEEEEGEEAAGVPIEIADCQPGKYVACLYDGKWWVGSILEVDEKLKDLNVSFMAPHGPAKSYGWPRRKDVCWIPITNVLRLLQTPLTNGRQYVLEKEDARFLHLCAK